MSFDEIYIKSNIRAVHDWPQDGVTFRDITPLLQQPKPFRMVIDALTQRYINHDLDRIAAIDSRGFLIGSVLAYNLNKPLILVRKKDKLPPPVISESYDLEYGSATVEIQQGSCEAGDKVLLVDDIIATGGTMMAASTLLKTLGADVIEAAALIDLPDLNGSTQLQNIGIGVYSLCAYEEEN
jgi:adenine phosphoribosyltransferase